MIALSLTTAAIVASSLDVQVDTSASLRGAAISSFNGAPIAGVMISIPEVQKFVVTDADGKFSLSGLPAGRKAVRISYDGRVTEDYTFTLQSERTKRIAVLLDLEAVDLDPLVVEARQANLWRDLAGFYERRRAYHGFGHFFTREQIDQARPSKISGFLTLEGIVTRCSTDCIPTRFSRGRLCAVPVSVNGVALREHDYDGIEVSEVAAIEVYRGVPPPDLSTAITASPGSSMWMGSGYPAAGSCGLVEIWLR